MRFAGAHVRFGSLLRSLGFGLTRVNQLGPLLSSHTAAIHTDSMLTRAARTTQHCRAYSNGCQRAWPWRDSPC